MTEAEDPQRGEQTNPARRPPPPNIDTVRAQIDKVIEGLTQGKPLKELPPTAADLQRQDLEQDIRLKKRYAGDLRWLLITQLLTANAVFILYAHFGMEWEIPSTVISVWLGATLSEIVGIVLVVTRYLFPRRDTP